MLIIINIKDRKHFKFTIFNSNDWYQNDWLNNYFYCHYFFFAIIWSVIHKSAIAILKQKTFYFLVEKNKVLKYF